MNTYYGNGLATSKDSPASTNGNNFGVGLIFASNDNLVEKNKIGGNVNGVYIDANGDVGNVIQGNSVFGNPSGQDSVEFGASIGADIQDMSPAGANTFADNRCLTYVGATAPAPCPRVPTDDGVEARYRENVGPSTAIGQTQRADLGLDNFGGGTTLVAVATLLIVGLVVPKRSSKSIRKRSA